MPRPKMPMPEHLLPDYPVEKVTDIVVTEQHMVFARLRWPDLSEQNQIWQVRNSIMTKLRTMAAGPDGKMKFGGPRENTHRRKNKPLGDSFVEHFEGRQKEVLDAIAAPLAPNSGASPMERHRAGTTVLEQIRKEAAEKRDADLYARMSEEEVQLEYAEMLVDGILNGTIDIDKIREQAEGSAPVDSTADELPPPELGA